MTEKQSKDIRMSVSIVSGLVFGAVAGYPLSYFFGLWLIKILKVSSFEGGAAFTLLYIMMIGIPALAIVLSLVNTLLALKAWPIKMLIVEVALALFSIAMASKVDF